MLLGIICNRKKHLVDMLQSVTHMYLEGVARYMGVQPVLIPAAMENGSFQVDAVIDRIDGVLLTGNTSNVHPDRYGMQETEAHKPFDLARDDAAMQLIDKALDRDMPLLAICRGYQELNVACGGTLHPTVHEIDGRIDHRMPESEVTDEKFGVQHRVDFAADGYFHKLLGVESAAVNSLHWQAVLKPAPKTARLRPSNIKPPAIVSACNGTLNIKPERTLFPNRYSPILSAP